MYRHNLEKRALAKRMAVRAKSVPVSMLTDARVVVFGFLLLAGFALFLAQKPAVAADSNTPAIAAEVDNPEIPFMDLMDSSGNSSDLAPEFDNGKWTLVKIWQANCHVCGEQAPVMSQAHTERADFNVVGISIDGRKGLSKANRFIDRHQTDYPNFIGDFAVISINYQLLTEEAFRGTPSYLLFNPENKLMAAQPGLISKDALFKFIDSNS